MNEWRASYLKPKKKSKEEVERKWQGTALVQHHPREDFLPSIGRPILSAPLINIKERRARASIRNSHDTSSSHKSFDRRTRRRATSSFKSTGSSRVARPRRREMREPVIHNAGVIVALHTMRDICIWVAGRRACHCCLSKPGHYSHLKTPSPSPPPRAHTHTHTYIYMFI
jgi:hypothetical protein